MKNLVRIRFLQNTKEDIYLVFCIERQAFVDEPHETRGGLEVLLEHGSVMALDEPEIKAVVESITLQKLLGLNLEKLPKDSPLRMVWENDKKNYVLRNIIRDYPGFSNYHYAHGIAVSLKGFGYGSAMLAEEIKKVVREDLMFGFVLSKPPNLRSIRMSLGQGSILDKIEDMVYEAGKPYFRIVYNGKVVFDERFAQKGVVLIGDYLSEMRELLKEGFIGVRFEQPSLLYFRKKT